MGASVKFYESIAHALKKAGARVVTNVPGHGGSLVFQAFREITGLDTPVSFHEEVAYTMAHGASIFGRRSATLAKAHGFAKAANSVLGSLAAGTTAGFVAIVFDDPTGAHSDSVLDTVTFLKGFGIPFRSAVAEDIYSEVLGAFVQSERLRLPVALLVNADDLGREVVVTDGDAPPFDHAYERDPAHFLVCPILAEYQNQVLHAKKSGLDWRILSRPQLPVVPGDLPPEFRSVMQQYVPLFESFRAVRGSIVTGDTSVSTLFAFPPYDCIDVCTHMGGSLALAIGAHLAGYSDVWAVTGDFAFLSAGILGLLEAVNRKVPLKVLIVDNAQSEVTGGQAVALGTLSRVLRPVAESVRMINPADGRMTEAVLREAASADALRIVVADYVR